MPRLLVEKGPDRGKSVTVVAGKQIVAGRDKSADLPLSDQMASRRHFMIASKGSVFGLKDLNSANGTLVNGRSATGAHKLQYGDSIQVGETLLSWMPEEQTDTKGGLIGHMIGGYRIEERLGRGAMGTVYKATQLSLGRTVALKVLSPDLVKDEKFCEMFLKEARAAGGLNHSNIIQVYDVGDENEHYYFSMEFAAKGSVLDELQAEGKIPLRRAVRILRDACSALDYAERKGLVHRDIKPDNLMVTEDESVKLGDLGLAMSTVELQGEQDGVFGTPHYIAPEQAMGKAIDHRADIYGLGATFYRMLTGKTLFKGTTVKEILKKQVREPHTPITEHLHDCPPAISNIVDRMLAKSPDERYQHASDIISDLSDYELLSSRKESVEGMALASRPRGFSPEQSQQIARNRQRRNLGIGGVVGFAALAAIVVSAIWVFGGSDKPPDDTVIVDDRKNNTTSDDNKRGDPDPALSPEAERANEALRDALSVAGFLVSDAPSLEQLTRAIEQLDTALRRNPHATDEWRKRVETRVAEIKEMLKEAEQSEAVIQEQWDETVRRAATLIEGFKFDAARELAVEFISRHKESNIEGVQQIVSNAEEYVRGAWPTRVSRRMASFEQEINQQVRENEQLPLAQRVAGKEALLGQVREVEEACDEESSKERLAGIAAGMERSLEQLRQQADRERREQVREALREAQASLHATLVLSAQDVASGAFAGSIRRLEQWEATSEEFKEFGDHEFFAPVRQDLQIRRDQTMFIFEGIRALADQGESGDRGLGRALPSPARQLSLLEQHPWPDDVSELLGDATMYVRVRVSREIKDNPWQLLVGPSDVMQSTEFDTPQKRQTLARMILHLFQHNHEASTEMKANLAGALPSGAPISTAVFAWLNELGAPEESIPFVEHAWENAPGEGAGHSLVREYYAWGLLARAEVMRRAGNESQASQFISRVRSEFGDTRAARRD
jgi:serine/threonine protein kinase